MTNDELQKLQGMAAARGYGRITLDPGTGKLRTTDIPVRRDKGFEASLKARSADLKTALRMAGPPMLASRARAAGAAAREHLSTMEAMFKPGTGMGQWAVQNPTDAAMIGTSMLTGGMSIPAEAGILGAEGAIGGYLQGGLPEAETKGLEGLTMGPLGRAGGALTRGAGKVLQYLGKNVTRKLVGTSGQDALDVFFRDLFSSRGPEHNATVASIDRYGWWRTFRRGLGVVKTQGGIYDDTMNQLDHQLEQAGAAKIAAAQQTKQAVLRQYQQAVRAGQRPTPQQISQIRSFISRLNKGIRETRAETINFRESLKATTAIRKRAFPEGLPDDGHLLKQGGPAYEAYLKMQENVDQQRQILSKYLGPRGAELFDEAKQEYAQVSAISDLARLPDLASETEPGKSIYNPHVLAKAMQDKEQNLTSRMGLDTFSEMWDIVGHGSPIQAGGDLPENMKFGMGLSTHFSDIIPRPRPYMTTHPPPKGEWRFHTIHSGPVPKGPATKAGEFLEKQASPLVGGGVKAAVPVAGSALGAGLPMLGTSVDTSAADQDDPVKILAKYK